MQSSGGRLQCILILDQRSSKDLHENSSICVQCLNAPAHAQSKSVTGTSANHLDSPHLKDLNCNMSSPPVEKRELSISVKLSMTAVEVHRSTVASMESN